MRKGVWFIILGVILLVAAGFLLWTEFVSGTQKYTVDEVKNSNVVEKFEQASNDVAAVTIKGTIVDVSGKNITVERGGDKLTVLVREGCKFWLLSADTSVPPKKIEGIKISGTKLEIPGSSSIELMGTSVTILAQLRESELSTNYFYISN